jgi:hypothetical protein
VSRRDVRGLIAATESNPTAFKAIKGRLAGHQSPDQAVAEQRVEIAVPNLAVERRPHPLRYGAPITRTNEELGNPN